MAGGVWHLLFRATMPTIAKMRLADEAMPDADPERIRRQALPRIAASVVAPGGGPARSEEMPDTYSSGVLKPQIVTTGPRPTASGLPANVHVSSIKACVTSPDGSPMTAAVAPS